MVKKRLLNLERGVLTKEHKEIKTDEPNGTRVIFTPDDTVFKNFPFSAREYLDSQMWNYRYLNAGLIINLNGKKYVSKNGFIDLLQRKTNEDELVLSPIVQSGKEDIEVAFTIMKTSMVKRYFCKRSKQLHRVVHTWRFSRSVCKPSATL